MKRIYVSGPITGTAGWRRRFEEAESALASRGWSVVNPAKVNSQLPPGLTHGEYMHMSFAMMDLCDAVYMLEGWERSEGARDEYSKAALAGMEILTERREGDEEAEEADVQAEAARIGQRP